MLIKCSGSPSPWCRITPGKQYEVLESKGKNMGREFLIENDMGNPMWYFGFHFDPLKPDDNSVMKAVLDSLDKRNILFQGNHDECLNYMRTHNDWMDLVYMQEDGSLGGLSSWVL